MMAGQFPRPERAALTLKGLHARRRLHLLHAPPAPPRLPGGSLLHGLAGLLLLLWLLARAPEFAVLSFEDLWAMAARCTAAQLGCSVSSQRARPNRRS